MKSWTRYRLADAVDINPPRPCKKGAEVKFVSMTDLKEFNKKVQGFTTRILSGGSRFANGDTLMARITPCLENGKTAFVDFLDAREVAGGSTEFIVLSEKSGVSTDQFVYYLATSPVIRQKAIQAMSGTSGRQRVETDVFKNIEVELPPLPEQDRIAKILGDLDAKIELNQQMNKTLEAMAQALFKEWFVDFRFPGHEKVKFVDELPEGWTILPLDEIADFLNGLALQKFPAVGTESLPVIKIRELNQGITDSTDKASRDIPPQYIVNDGDVLFSWSGSLQVCLWCHGKGALNQHLFKVTSSKYPKWFYYYWTRRHLLEFQQIAEGKATTMGHIQRRHLSAAMTAVPLKKVLEEMGGIMAPLLDQLILNGVQMKRLSNLRDSLLPRLMAGEMLN